MTSDPQSESGGVVSSTALLDDFTMDERRNFVMRHTQQLAAWQQPNLRDDYKRYIETAPEDWINKSFLQFAEMHENNKDAIRARSVPVV